MIRQFDLKKDEIIRINDLAHYRQMLTSKGLAIARGLYFAAPDGIYIARNRGKRAGKVFGLIGGFFAIPILFIVLIVGLSAIGSLLIQMNVTSTTEFVLWIFLLVLGPIMIAATIYGIIKIVKKMRKIIKEPDMIEAELIAPWHMVKSIVITDVKTENTNLGISGVINPQLMNIGMFRVLLTDGREIDIWPVHDPYSKLNYIKNKLNLTF